MKLKYDFETVEIDGEFMAVPVGGASTDFRAMLKLNESASTILELLKEETTEEEIVAKLCEKYSGEPEAIKSAVNGFIEELKKADVLL